ncbi:MerR family transcriptional regulator [Amycolatopsis methanolica]|uniref:MerR family transcriptional regulator n=1 Tax=Amycolatopsis methanolica TaxID=1814 RepID=UPI00343E2BFE
MTTYRISQLAERVGLRPTTLRFYEQAGLLPARRSDSGYRLYDDQALERLTFIGAAKTLGLPLDEIRDLLDVWEDGLCTDVRGRLRPMLVARIAEAEQRAAELDAFTERLRQALVEIDGPPRPGRCEPGCGFLHHNDPHGGDAPAPVPVELLPRRPGTPAERSTQAPTEAPPIACTLTGDDQADRIQQWQHLLAHAVHREPLDGGVRIDLPATLAGEVAALAAAEQRCCAFFDFTLHLVGQTVRLDVRAPAEAAPLLADVFGTSD